MSESNEYIVSLEQLTRLREAGSLSEAEFTQERANLLNLHKVAGEPGLTTEQQRADESVGLGGGASFFISYVVFMIPTYVLPYLGSNSIIANGLWSAFGMGLLPQFWLHVLALYALMVICWTRGARIRAPWLPVFPAIAAMFDLVPILSWIPLVPTGCHVAALIIGVTKPALEPPSVARGKNFAGFVGFLAIAAYGLFYPVIVGTRTDAPTSAPDINVGTFEAEPTELSENAVAPVGDDVASEPAEPTQTASIDAAPEPAEEVPEGDSLEVATHKALNSGEVTLWREGQRNGTVTPSEAIAISGASCRTAVAAELINGTPSDSVSTTWCRRRGRPWERR